MKNNILLSLTLFLFAGSAVFGQHKIKAEDAKNHLTHQDTVVGKVFHIKATDNATYIDIGGNYPDNPFSVVILAKDVPVVGDVNKYDGKTIEIIGAITDRKGKPQIVVTDGKQLRLAK